MKLALLGTDPEAIQLIASAKSAGHDIVWLGDVRPEDAAAVRPFATSQVVDTGWELLLDGATVDAVLVGRGAASGELREEQLKRLAAAAVPLLVIHPTGHSVLTYYELDMIRREANGVLRHYNPLMGHPVIETIADWVRNGHDAIGTIQQIACQREIVSKSREDALGWLARDVELLAAIAGNVRHVSAVGPHAAAAYSSLQVQLTTPQLSSLSWSVAPSSRAASQGEFKLVGERGTVTLHIPDHSSVENRDAWQLETNVDEHRRQLLPPFDAPQAAIQQLVATVSEADVERRSATSTWAAATQSMEVVDAVELSLQKGRTIEVHQQQLTEQLAFRGTMAALGCGLLFMGFAVVIFAGLTGIFETATQEKLIPHWPLVLLATLAFFLLLQFVPLLATKRGKSKSPPQSK